MCSTHAGVWSGSPIASRLSLPGLPYTCLEAATGRALLRQHMDNTGEDHPLNKLRVVIEPGPRGVPVLPQLAGGSGASEGQRLGEAPAAGGFVVCNKTSRGGGTRGRRWLREACDRHPAQKVEISVHVRAVLRMGG